jgi:predicted nuclease of predicted toxin-antitoxin system
VKILFDQGTPVPLRHFLSSHSVSTAYEMGWSNLENGDLLKIAERSFDIIITTDQNLKYQQNLSDRQIAILVLPTTNWLEIQNHVAEVSNLVDQIKSGEYRELQW